MAARGEKATGMVCWSGCVAAGTIVSSQTTSQDGYLCSTWRQREGKSKSNKRGGQSAAFWSGVSTRHRNRGRACTEQGGVRDCPKMEKEGGTGEGVKTGWAGRGRKQGARGGPSDPTVHFVFQTVRVYFRCNYPIKFTGTLRLAPQTVHHTHQPPLSLSDPKHSCAFHAPANLGNQRFERIGAHAVGKKRNRDNMRKEKTVPSPQNDKRLPRNHHFSLSSKVATRAHRWAATSAKHALGWASVRGYRSGQSNYRHPASRVQGSG